MGMHSGPCLSSWASGLTVGIPASASTVTPEERKKGSYKQSHILVATNHNYYNLIELDRYCAGARYPILSAEAIPDRYQAVQIFCNENAILCGV